ncbi:transcriptional regulator [Thiohalocapsa marina]|uniref:Transcriptional regulator n=1 Tax=Thiohalocapsa marina TaxID=424902 RepID=A0A5M8FP02_9GAMM|nr:transcriptional regulator [Thiohalocapsa marina]KAA6184145.1 transcriptional regulator [Thiohalocapsa marina]
MTTDPHRTALPANAVEGDALITAAEARRLAGGISDMTLWRWLRKGIIPQPIVIKRRRYWRRGEYLAALHSAGQHKRDAA